jgi:hypothetical protein
MRIGLWVVETPTFCLDNRRTDGAFYPPGKFLVLIFVRRCFDPSSIVRREGLGKLKKKIHLIGARFRDFQGCSIVAQPTTLPRAHLYVVRAEML